MSRLTQPNQSRGCVKSADPKFGNDQFFGVRHFDETSRWMGWSKNEFSHRLSLQATRDGVSRSASRFTLVGPACLSDGW